MHDNLPNICIATFLTPKTSSFNAMNNNLTLFACDNCGSKFPAFIKQFKPANLISGAGSVMEIDTNLPKTSFTVFNAFTLTC